MFSNLILAHDALQCIVRFSRLDQFGSAGSTVYHSVTLTDVIFVLETFLNKRKVENLAG